MQAPHHGDQGLLGGILGVAPVAEELGRQRVDAVVLGAEQLFERDLVARLRGNDQLADVVAVHAGPQARTTVTSPTRSWCGSASHPGSPRLVNHTST